MNERHALQMNKKALTEADIRTKFITPALTGDRNDKWNLLAQIATTRGQLKAKLLEALTR